MGKFSSNLGGIMKQEFIQHEVLSSPLSSAIEMRDKNTLNMVRDAINRRQALLAFQPIVQSNNPTTPAYYEGLLRVLDSTGRVIPAREFIQVSETTELGRTLDCLAIEMGLSALSDNKSLRLAINMSARSIGYPRWKSTLLDGIRNDPSVAERLILEISESSAMLMPDLVSVFMGEMQELGVSFALDDFGSGYTAFRYLRDFYFDMVKIDGSFIQGIANSPDNQALAQALISVAKHFEMYTVAELVETKEDAEYLMSIGVDCLQGHYFGAATIEPNWDQRNFNETTI